jgi:hypothetical protein
MPSAGDTPKQWVNAFRRQVLRLAFRLDTNNLIERFFKNLKYYFLRGKTSKRMDHLLSTLLVDLASFYVARLQAKALGRKTNWKLIVSVCARETAAAALCAAGPACIQVRDAAGGDVVVKSQSTDVWHEVCLRHARCSCPDSSGLLCKHIRAAARFVALSLHH